jgi:hypothetical protein
MPIMQNDVPDDPHSDSGSGPFSVALYARLNSIIDRADDPDHVDEYDDARRTPTPSPSHDRPEMLPQLPQRTFADRVQKRLHEMLAEETSSRSGSSSHAARRNESRVSSFVDRAKAQLHDHFDRVLPLSNGEPLLEEDPDGYLLAGLKDDAAVHREFASRYHVTLPAVCDPVETLVKTAVSDYEAFFAAEADIVDAAKQYDLLQNWIVSTNELFQSRQIEPGTTTTTTTATTTTALDDDDDRFTTQLHQQLCSSADWNAKFAAAKQTWAQLCVSRHALKKIHDTVGGTTGCRICFNDQVSTLLVPCGHVLCGACATRVECCPFCNSQFYARQAIYFM